ncbi:hypothetical protein EVA_12371 [gut metagenome]|uniref:Uncharacterized protein n=1 Tax=gut metagenome TaxID=749906 RepID=J9FWY9_9ZZZZ
MVQPVHLALEPFAGEVGDGLAGVVPLVRVVLQVVRAVVDVLLPVLLGREVVREHRRDRAEGVGGVLRPQEVDVARRDALGELGGRVEAPVDHGDVVALVGLRDVVAAPLEVQDAGLVAHLGLVLGLRPLGRAAQELGLVLLVVELDLADHVGHAAPAVWASPPQARGVALHVALAAVDVSECDPARVAARLVALVVVERYAGAVAVDAGVDLVGAPVRFTPNRFFA